MLQYPLSIGWNARCNYDPCRQNRRTSMKSGLVHTDVVFLRIARERARTYINPSANCINLNHTPLVVDSFTVFIIILARVPVWTAEHSNSINYTVIWFSKMTNGRICHHCYVIVLLGNDTSVWKLRENVQLKLRSIAGSISILTWPCKRH